jgi:2-(1,2-epoxy-1,2-dihydrophenyl)acetyl-CoA isomerase
VIISNVQNRVATLTFNRPDKLNALNQDLIDASLDSLRTWAADPEVGAIVLTGAGRAFCAGGDIAAMANVPANLTLEQKIDHLRRWQELSSLIYTHPKVVIAAVNGFAMGAGLGICLSCDLRIASDQAKFGTAYAQVGFGGDFGTTWLLTHLAGPAKAKELMFFADPIDAPAAETLGLVNRVVAHEQLMTAVQQWAERIAHGPLTSFRYMKANINMAAATDFRKMLDREAETHSRCGQTEDHREGVRAFLEKRKPHFQGT